MFHSYKLQWILQQQGGIESGKFRIILSYLWGSVQLYLKISTCADLWVLPLSLKMQQLQHGKQERPKTLTSA